MDISGNGLIRVSLFDKENRGGIISATDLKHLFGVDYLSNYDLKLFFDKLERDENIETLTRTVNSVISELQNSKNLLRVRPYKKEIEDEIDRLIRIIKEEVNFDFVDKTKYKAVPTGYFETRFAHMDAVLFEFQNHLRPLYRYLENEYNEIIFEEGKDNLTKNEFYDKRELIYDLLDLFIEDEGVPSISYTGIIKYFYFNIK